MDENSDNYREAVCVHLHDQRLMITDDTYTHGTDSQWADENPPEYTLSTDLAKVIGQLLGVHPNDLAEAGINRGYAAYPVGSQKLQRLEVQIVSDRIIDLRMKFSDRQEKEGWIEEWTYAGSFTVKWAEAT